MISSYKREVIAEAANKKATFEPAQTVEETFLDSCITRILVHSRKSKYSSSISISDIRDGILEALHDFRLIIR